MSFFLYSVYRQPENSTTNGLLLSIFQKSVEKFGRTSHNEYYSIQGKRAAKELSNFAIYRTSKDYHTPTD